LGAYFRVVFHGAAHFRDEDKTEWVRFFLHDKVLSLSID
jgi:hypothetical protein